MALDPNHDLLTFAELDGLQVQALSDGLQNRRDQLMARINPLYVAGLDETDDRLGQLILDLAVMNRARRIIGNVTPLVVWLLTARALVPTKPDSQRFYTDLSETVEQRANAGTPAPGDLPVSATAAAMAIPERLIYRNDLVGSDFVAGAVRTAHSVARLVVPQIEGGMAREHPSNGKPLLGYGTCWLIGPRFIMTNWHVIQARAPGEDLPDDDDLRRQCAGATVNFDYDDPDVPTVSVAVEGLAHGDATLDYAVLRLAADSGRPPLPLRQDALRVNADDPFPVNVVQHPGGAAKQFGIRNNLVAALDGIDLAYFTDTAGGSSGSPVCDDRWRVIALHKASTMKFGVKNFQGKTTAWVNVGTPIRLIMDNLQQQTPLWPEITAVVAP